jgi:hypothetical protein
MSRFLVRMMDGVQKVRVATGGGLTCALASNLLGNTTAFGSSAARDAACAVVGGVLCLWLDRSGVGAKGKST